MRIRLARALDSGRGVPHGSLVTTHATTEPLTYDWEADEACRCESVPPAPPERLYWTRELRAACPVHGDPEAERDRQRGVS